MKMTRVALVLCCVMIVYGVARAQDNSQAPQVLDDLKLQLIDVQAKQEAVTEQIQQLDEALKPENIEHSLAGFGSTRPEELREQRRRQLLKEKTSLAAELTALNDKRAKLEEAIATAEVQAYHQSARGPVENGFRSGLMESSWLLAMLLVAVVVIATGIGVFLSFRKRVS